MKRCNRSENLEFCKETELMAQFAKALSNPIRIAILEYLDQQSSCCTGDIVDIFPLAQSTISQHLKELKSAGLIQGELNPPKIKYCINRRNWQLAQRLFEQFFQTKQPKQINRNNTIKQFKL